MAKKLDVDLRVTRLLLEVGVMAVWIKRVAEGEEIIRSVKAFRNEVPQPGTALAAALIYQGRPHEAIEELEGVLRTFPNHQLGKSLLALAYAEVGRHDWDTLCKQVIDDGRDEWAIEMARETLGYDYGKAPNPHYPAYRGSMAVFA